jgi:ATP-dependent exoDNAse (exonuclease V) beta subunit
LKNSPFKEALKSIDNPDTLSHRLRGEILEIGYGPFTLAWADKLAPICDRRDRSRLEQLVEMAYSYQARSTLRADAFVDWVRHQSVTDPSGANVRVLTIHKAKGLQFDAVFLPELDVSLTGRPPAFVVDRDSKSLEITFVSRYANQTIQALLADQERAAFEKYWQHETEESLSNLYVAMTRAAHALYLYIPGPRKKRENDSWYNLLQQALAPHQASEGCALLAERGDRNWHSATIADAGPATPQQPHPHPVITFGKGRAEHQRGLERVAPSRREGGAKVDLKRLFQPSEGTGMAAGTIYHAWFETIGWLEDGIPSDEVLLAAAQKKLSDLPLDVRSKLDEMRNRFRKWLEIPAIRSALERSAYASPSHPGFPGGLKSLWKEGISPLKVERERRFLVRIEDEYHKPKFWNGSLDRVVWLGDAGKIVAADILDFKTDDLRHGDEKSLTDRIEHYLPQLEAYRRAVARLADLSEKRISARLLFPFAKCVREV